MTKKTIYVLTVSKLHKNEAHLTCWNLRNLITHKSLGPKKTDNDSNTG